MITTFYPPHHLGGDGIFVQQLSRALARRGHHVEVIHCVDAHHLMSGAVARSLPESPDRDGVIVHALRSRAGRLSPLWTHQLGGPGPKARSIRDILARGFDVVHFHNVSLVGGPQVLTYGRGVKLYTMQEYWLVCPTHLLYKFGREVCERPSCLACTVRHGRPPQLWRYTGKLRRALAHLDALVAMSPSCAERHRSLAEQVPIVELPAFVTEEESVSAAAPASPEVDPYFLFVGRLEAIKGLQTVLPLFTGEGAATAPPGARLLVAGTGSDERELRRLAAGNPRIEFLGRVDRRILPALYRGARALVMPSLTLEISPLVMLEAFQQRTPVLARARGSMLDYIRASGGGVAYRDDAELAAAMSAAMDPAWRDDRGERGFRAYRQRWTEDAHLTRYLELVGSLLPRVSSTIG